MNHVPTLMEKRPAIEVFNDWALNGKDMGMERGHAAPVHEMLDFIFKQAEYLPNKFSAIDVGCGNGWVVRLLKNHSACEYVEGIDGAMAMINKAKQTDPDGNYSRRILPKFKPSRKYDFLHSMEFLYYLEKPQNMLKVFFDKWININGWAVIGIDHYLENEESLTWPEQVGVNMTTLSVNQWLTAWKDAGFSNITHWQTGKKAAETLIVVGQKLS